MRRKRVADNSDLDKAIFVYISSKNSQGVWIYLFTTDWQTTKPLMKFTRGWLPQGGRDVAKKHPGGFLPVASLPRWNRSFLGFAYDNGMETRQVEIKKK